MNIDFKKNCYWENCCTDSNRNNRPFESFSTESSEFQNGSKSIIQINTGHKTLQMILTNDNTCQSLFRKQ